MIRLNVFIRTTESNREELVRTAKELAAASLKDEGCVAYDLFESATRSDVLMTAKPGAMQRPSGPRTGVALHDPRAASGTAGRTENRKVRLLIRSRDPGTKKPPLERDECFFIIGIDKM